MSRKNHFESSPWINRALRGCLRNNYSLLDILLGRWRYRPTRFAKERAVYASLSQRHQIRSRFL